MKAMILSLMSLSLVAMDPKPLNNIVTVNVTLPPTHRHHHHKQAPKEQKDIPDDASCGQCCGVLLSLLKSVAKLVK